MRSFILLLSVLGCVVICEGQPVFISKSSTVHFFSEATVENIEATNASANSILNTVTNEIAFIVPIRGFKFEKELMQEHFNEKYLESDKFPQATFRGIINDSLDWTKEGVYDISATGTLTIHGVDRPVTEKGKLEIKGKELNLESSMKVAVGDYNITIPKLLFQNIADTIQVDVHFLLQPYQKK